MDSLSVAILSQDMEYSLALGEALSSIRNGYLITLYERVEELGGFDLLLTDFPEEGLGPFRTDRRVVRLIESEADVVKDLNENRFQLYKYGSCRELAADMRMIFSVVTGREQITEIGTGSCHMFAFISASGGAGKTTLAMGIAQELVRYHGKKVLYVSLEEVESTLLYMEKRRGTPGIGEFLYHLFKREGARPDQEGFLLWDRFGVMAFMPDPGKNKLKELSAQQLVVFFETVIRQGGFDCVLVDMGEILSENALFLLSQCSKIALLENQEGERERRFFSYLHFVLGKRAETAFVRVKNKASREADAEAADQKDWVRVDFDGDSILHDGVHCEISIDQDLGTGIRMLSQKLTSV